MDEQRFSVVPRFARGGGLIRVHNLQQTHEDQDALHSRLNYTSAMLLSHEPISGRYWTHFIDGEVDAGVGNDAEQVRQVAAVEVAHALAQVDLARAVHNAAVLLSLAQRQPRLQHLCNAHATISVISMTDC